MDPEEDNGTTHNNVESLQNQLTQMKSLLPFVDGVEKVEMENVVSQLEELILTIMSSSAANTNANQSSAFMNPEVNKDDDDEYALFSVRLFLLLQ